MALRKIGGLLIVHAVVLAAVVSLGAAEPFSIIGRSGVTATGTMRVTGNVGAASGAVTGVKPAVGEILPGGDALKDVATAWDDMQRCSPSVHCLSSIIYAFNGGADDVWIIQIDGDLIIPPGSSMKLLGGAKSSNVFWRVNGSATIGERNSFVGTLIALRSITVREGVTVSGRLIARQGTVTLTTDDVNFCCHPIEQSSLPNGIANVQYSETIIPSGGTQPYTFSLFSGSLPLGLGPLEPNGTLSGVPRVAGSYTFIVLVQDYKGCTSIHTHTIVICGTATVEPATLPDAVVGYAYSVPITTAPSGTHIFTTTALPDGMTLTPASCAPEALLCGTPRTAGCYTFTITATDCDGICSGSREYKICVTCPVIKVLPPTLDAVTVGVLYRKVMTASGSLEPYLFTGGPSTPPGVTIDPSGTLSFMPDREGDYNIDIKATDSHGCLGTRHYTITAGCPTITVTPESLPPATIGVVYEAQLNAGPLPTPYEFTPANPLPWLTLSDTGFLSGKPPASGQYTFVVTATHKASGCSGTKTYMLDVPPCPTITISPTTLSRGTVNVLYSKVITIAGGTPPYTVTPNTAGPLTLSPQGPQNEIVKIFGTPTTTGIITFTVTATDSNGCIGMQKYHIAIDAPQVPGPVIPTLSEWMLAILAIALASLAIRRSG